MEDKTTYKKILLVVIAVLSVYGAYASGNNYRNYVSSEDNLEVLENSESVSADNLSFNNSDGDIQNTDNNNSKVSYDSFLNIKMGMSYEEVKNILGDGTEISTSDMRGKKTTLYEFEGKGISNITITLQDDCVTSKSQLNLINSSSNVSLDDYNKINIGMSYDKVKELLNEGQLITESSAQGYTSCIYSYINKDGSNANFTFEDNVLKVKSQYNLK